MTVEQGLPLEIVDLAAGYQGSQVIGGITLRVRERETVMILGPNGHGKTTLLRAISGLLRPQAGTVRLLGREVTGWAPEDIASTGLVHVPQGDLPFPMMSVTENLLLGAYAPHAWRDRKGRLERIFEMFPQLASRRRAQARSLSGGERRMLAIGRGLMAGGRMLMIDEPSLGLAPLVIQQVYAAIAEIKASGIPILLVDENASNAAGLADTVYVLESGSFVADGPADSLLQDTRLLAAYLG
jgi:branched-chain amino acid transport system ATP-binding protein